MPDLRTRLKESIARLVAALIKDHEREGLTKLPKPRPPASDKDIEKYENHLQLKLPPSYREFLKLHNGYEGLAWPGDMLSIQDVMPGGQWYDAIQHWKQTCARYGGGEVLSGIVVAQQGEPNDYVYLDPQRPSRGKELTVVKFSPSYSGEYADLVEYFEYLISVLDIELPPPDENKTKRTRGKKKG